MDIKNLKQLLQPYLEGKYDIISYTWKSLLPPGENYGSVMVDLNIKVQNKTKQEEIIKCVAKTVPPSEALWALFNTPVTFKKEIAFYETFVPTLNEFARKNNIDNLMHFFPKCFGARISLDSMSDVVDHDAVLILENLMTQGYITGDRFTGFNYETSKFIIKHMATMHAASIALKLTNPKEFDTKIRPLLHKGIQFIAQDDMVYNLVKTIKVFASRNPKCIPLLERIEIGIRKIKGIYTYTKLREPFATIVHNDFWTNNMLMKFEGDTPVSVKFLDFQIYEYGSPARDLIFFLYSSVELETLEQKIDELITFYYDNLEETLLKLNCDITNINLELFMEELNELALDVEFPHIMFMLTPLFTLKDKATELDEWSTDQLAPEDEHILHENYHKRLQFTILNFAKRNWI